MAIFSVKQFCIYIEEVLKKKMYKFFGFYFEAKKTNAFCFR